MIKSGIVILNYNSYNLTCNLASKCSNFDEINQVVIVDNDSKDDFSEFAELNKKIHYIKNHNNSGYSSGNNLGLKYLHDNGYKIGFIANPDVEFSEDTVSKIIDNFKKNKFKYPVTSCSRYLNGSRATGQFWWIPSYTKTLFESTYIGRKIQDKKCVKKTNTILNQTNTDSLEVEVVGGAFFAADLDFLDSIGYLDEGTFLWYEENILAYKVKKSGKKELLLLNCSYEHNHKKITKRNYKLKIFMKSKHYYLKQILGINFIQEIILYLFEGIGLVEQFVINIIYTILRK